MKTYDNFNPQILKNIPANMANILEFGCDTGKLGAAYKDQNPGACWVGVDINPESVELAQSRIDVAFTADANQKIDHPDIDHSSFDCLVYGDVLEHLLNPGSILRDHLQYLRPHGHVVACIPNIHHWSIVKKLVSSQWQYEPKGILDETHLRFFSRQSIIEMFNSTGLTTVTIKPLIFRENDTKFLGAIARACNEAGIDYDEQTLLPFQYIAIGTRGEAVL